MSHSPDVASSKRGTASRRPRQLLGGGSGMDVSSGSEYWANANNSDYAPHYPAGSIKSYGDGEDPTRDPSYPSYSAKPSYGSAASSFKAGEQAESSSQTLVQQSRKTMSDIMQARDAFFNGSSTSSTAASSGPTGSTSLYTADDQSVAPSSSPPIGDTRTDPDNDTASTQSSGTGGSASRATGSRADMKPPTLPKMRTITPATKKVPRAQRASVCSFKCRSSLRAVRFAIRKLGWDEVHEESHEASVVWLEHGDSVTNLSPYQVTSKMEGMLQICKKTACSISLNRMAKAFPPLYTFVPKTWILRRDGIEEAAHLEKTMDERRGWVFIAKPSSGCSGRGVVLVKRWHDLNPIIREIWPEGFDRLDTAPRPRTKKEYVVQRYVTKPLLVHGYKFDCRLYCVVTSLTPLKAYLFEEGIARFCTVPYERPKSRNIGNACMHLTNYAVNKRSDEFRCSRNHDEGSKRSMSSVFQLMEEAGGPTVEQLWSQMECLMERTLLAIKPSLVEHYANNLAGKVGHHPHGPKVCHIVGFDVIFEDDFRPKLLELNANCSLSCLSPMLDPETGSAMLREDGSGPRLEVSALDLSIKSELVAQTLLLANPTAHVVANDGRSHFLEQCGGLAPTSVFSEPLPSEEQRRDANPPRIPDRPHKAPAMRKLDFFTRHSEIFDLVQSHEHTYRIYRGLIHPTSQLFTKQSFRTLVNSGYFLHEKAIEQSDDDAPPLKVKFFSSMGEAEAFFIAVLRDANRDSPKPVAGLKFGQFLRSVCVELGARIDSRSEFHAIHAFVRRCVGYYEWCESSASETDEDERADEDR